MTTNACVCVCVGGGGFIGYLELPLVSVLYLSSVKAK